MATMELIDAQRIAGIGGPNMLDGYYAPKPLTAEQLEDIEISRRQFTAGLGIPHEDVMKEFDAEYPDDED